MAEGSGSQDVEQAGDASTSAEPKGRSGIGRRIAIVVLSFIALVCGFMGSVSGWAWWLVFDTGNFVSVVAPLSSDDDVSKVIANRLVEQAFEGLDLETVVADALPDQASFLAGPITTGAEGFAEDAVQALIQSDAFQTVWREALTLAHNVAMDVLRGNGDNLIAEDGKVVLDLSGAAEAVSDALNSVGLDVFDPDDLPDDFGQIVLLEDEQLGATQQAVQLLDIVSIWMPLIALAAWAGTLALARDRRRMIAIIGLAVALSSLLELALLRVTRRSLIDNVPRAEGQDAVATVWDELTATLRSGMWAVVVFGLLVAGGAYLLGPAARAVRVRRGLRNRLHELRGERDPDADPDLAERLVRPYRRPIEVAVFVLALLYLVTLATPSIGSVLVVAVALVLVLALVELAAGAPSSGTRGAKTPEPQASSEDAEVDAGS